MRSRAWRGAPVLLLAGWVASLPPPARDQTTVQTQVPLDWLVLDEPCTGEKLSFSGAVQVDARVTVSGLTADLALRLDASQVRARGQKTGTPYETRAVDDKHARTTVPSTVTFTLDAPFSSPAGARFLAKIPVLVTVSGPGNLGAILGQVELACRGKSPS